MNRKIILLFFLTIALVVAACGGGAEATEAPVQNTSSDSSESADTSTQNNVFYLQITNVKGTVEVRSSANDTYAPAEVGQRLGEGAQIRTGTDGIVALYRDKLTMVIVDNNSEAEVKTLQGTVEVPITILTVLTGAVGLEHHAEKLPEGAILRVETPEGNTGNILGSTVRVQYNPETKLMTATCLTGTCEFVRGDQKLTLEAGQAVDIEGLQPPPGAPEEMSVDQANQFLAMGYQLCGGCPISLSEIYDGGLQQTSPAPEDIGDGSGSPDEMLGGDNTDNTNSSEDSNNGNDSNSNGEDDSNSNGDDASNSNGDDDSNGSGGDDSGDSGDDSSGGDD